MSCPDCNFNLQALEEFSVNWELAKVEGSDGAFTTTGTFETMPATEHGTIAVHARHLQLKLTANVEIAEGVTLGAPHIPIGGQSIHEELHIDGQANRASFHFDSSVFKGCILLDAPAGIPPAAQMAAPQVNQNLAQAEQMAPQLAQQFATHGTVDGEAAVIFAPPHVPPRIIGHPMVAFSDETHPLLVGIPVGPQDENMVNTLYNPPPSLQDLGSMGIKFTDYTSGVAGQFDERACTIAGHSATISVIATNPELKSLMQHRVAVHENNLRSILETSLINTRFNFIPLDLTQRMFQVSESGCSDSLFERPSSNVVPAGLFSFAMGVMVAVGAWRSIFSKKKVALADQETA